MDPLAQYGIKLPDATSVANDPGVQAAQGSVNTANQQLQTAQNQYNAMNTGGGSFSNALKQALLSKWNDNQDLITQKNNYLNALSNAGNNYANTAVPFLQGMSNTNGSQGVVNPYAVNAGKTAAINQAYTNYSNANDLLNQRMGTLNDLLQTGQGIYQGGVNAAEGAEKSAETAQQLAMQNYQNAYNAAQAVYQNQLAKAQIAGNITQAQIMASAYHQPTPADTLQNEMNNYQTYLANTKTNGANPIPLIQQTDLADQQNNLYNYLRAFGGGMPNNISNQMWNIWTQMRQQLNNQRNQLNAPQKKQNTDHPLSATPISALPGNMNLLSGLQTAYNNY